jgi:hypothetical protein
MRDLRVLGEHGDELVAELLELTFTFPPGELALIHGPVPIDGAVMRALHRAEAELLVADAEAMRAGAYRHRTPGQRRADDFVLVFERLRDAATARDRRALVAPQPARVPTRKRKRRTHGGR